MNDKTETAGQTATTNPFDAEIVRLKQERDARFSEINQRINTLANRAHRLKGLQEQALKQMHELSQQKDIVGKEYRQKADAVREKMDEYYCNPNSHEHYKLFAAFCDLHPEVLQMWREFRQAEEGGEQ